MRAVQRFFAVSILIFAVVTLAGCGLFGYVGAPSRYTLWGSEFVLAWDPPASLSSHTEITGYTLYYRPYPPSGGGTWLELGGSRGLGTLTFRVDGTELPPGRYEFGIRSVDTDGTHSDIHTSTDRDADPATGWYLNWLGGAP